MNQRRGRFLAGIGAGAVAAEFGPATRAVAQTTSKLSTLRVAVAPSDGVTSLMYAKYAGWFEKAGLDVQLQMSQNGAAVAAAVMSGAYDVGNSSVSSIFIAHEKGFPFVFIAPVSVWDNRVPGFTGALALKDSTVILGKDAENAPIGVVSLSGTGHDAFCAWVDQHGGDPTTIRFVEIPFSASGTALLQHRIVATETVSPAMTLALDTGNFRFIPVYAAIAPQYLISAWFTSRDFSAKNPEVVRTFARVLAASSTYCNVHHAETAPLTSQFTGIPVDVLTRMPRANLGVTLSPEVIQPAIAAAAKYGTIKKAFPAAELIDPLVLNLRLSS